MPTVEPTKLELALISRIQKEGPMTFRDFMASALYDTEFGYYNTSRAKIGATGDYYTSSNVHAAFGAVLANFFVELWRELEDNGSLRERGFNQRPLILVEVGAGTGLLAQDVLTALKKDHRIQYDRVRYLIVETSEPMRRLQRERLAGAHERVEWCDISELQRHPIEGVVFSNELFDAMPVHRVRKRLGNVQEMYVSLATDSAAHSGEGVAARESKEVEARQPRLTGRWDVPSTDEINRYLVRRGVTLREGQVVEIGLDCVKYLRQLAAALASGFLITIDYGDVSAHLYGLDRTSGTLRCFHRHSLSESPFERIGEMDITASTNFSAIMGYGREFGLEPVSFERQTSFLLRNGLVNRIAEMLRRYDDSNAGLKDRLAIKNLFVPGGVSDNFRVLVQRKDAR